MYTEALPYVGGATRHNGGSQMIPIHRPARIVLIVAVLPAAFVGMSAARTHAPGQVARSSNDLAIEDAALLEASSTELDEAESNPLDELELREDASSTVRRSQASESITCVPEPTGSIVFIEALSRAVTAIDLTASPPLFAEVVSRAYSVRVLILPPRSEAISRAYTVTIHTSSLPVLAEVLSRATTVINRTTSPPVFSGAVTVPVTVLVRTESPPLFAEAIARPVTVLLYSEECGPSESMTEDCNGNGLVDRCEKLPDCNGNANPDTCDLARGMSEDIDNNGIPDECQDPYPLPDFIWSIYLESNTDDPGDHRGQRPAIPGPLDYCSPLESRSDQEPPIGPNFDKFFMNWFYKYHPVAPGEETTAACGDATIGACDKQTTAAHWTRNVGLYPMLPSGSDFRETGKDIARLRAHLKLLRGTADNLFVNHSYPWWYVEPVMTDRDLMLSDDSGEYIHIRDRASTDPADPDVITLIDRYEETHNWTLMDDLINAIWDAGCKPFPIIGEMTMMPYFMPYGQPDWQRDAGPDGLGATDVASLIGTEPLPVSARDRYLDHLYLHARAVVQHCKQEGQNRPDQKVIKLWNLENELNTRPLSARTGYFASKHIDGKNCCGSLLADYEFLGEILKTLSSAVKHADPQTNVLHNFSADFDDGTLDLFRKAFECRDELNGFLDGQPWPENCLGFPLLDFFPDDSFFDFLDQTIDIGARCTLRNVFNHDAARIDRLDAAHAAKPMKICLRDWKQYIDVVGVDSFPFAMMSSPYFTTPVAKLNQAREIVGPDTKIMLSETMYYTRNAEPVDVFESWCVPFTLGWTEGNQAEYLNAAASDVLNLHETDPNIVGFGWFVFASMEAEGRTSIDTMEAMGGWGGLIGSVDSSRPGGDVSGDDFHDAWEVYRNFIAGPPFPVEAAYPGIPHSLPPPKLVDTQPEAVTDLVVSILDRGVLKFVWTSPRVDKEEIQRAARYFLRAARELVEEGNWTNAEGLTTIHVPQQPKGAGCPEQLNVLVDLAPGTWYFAILAQDDDGNLGPVSNSPSLVLEPPCAVRVLASDPPDHAIDARQPWPVKESNISLGWDSVTLDFPVCMVSAGLTTTDFFMTEVGGDGVPPNVLEVTPIDDDTVVINFDEPIEPGAWTVIAHASGQASIRLGFLPGDANADGVSDASDVSSIVDHLNGMGSPLEVWQCDIDRSSACGPHDILMTIDLLNGAGTFEAWFGNSLPAEP